MDAFFIFDTEPDGTFTGGAIGPFTTKDSAVDHATDTTAVWSDWVVGRVEVVHRYTYDGD